MPAPFPTARDGQRVARHPSGFPSFFRRRTPRIVTADVWSLLRHLVTKRLDGQQERAALAYIEQAFEFYEAASNPRTGSKPLLYYYSFLNLAKAALLCERTPIPPVVAHGIKDPKANVRKRLRLEGQHVRIDRRLSDHSALFPEFVSLLGGSTRKPSLIRVIDRETSQMWGSGLS